MPVTTVTVGAGQAGLAMSRCLSERSVDHLLLERGRVANSWRTERWDSPRLLTPNWMNRLPGHTFTADDPEGYLTAAEVADELDAYRHSFDAPVNEYTTVESITETDEGFEITTDTGDWRTRTVVVATGSASTPHRPAMSALLPRSMRQMAPIDYEDPHQLDAQRVLVVGASASGIQLADELARAGIGVTLAVGEHIRLPRTYRGMDIYWWMDSIGVLDDRYDEVDDLARARRLPSAQLVGSLDRRDLDLNTISKLGVEIVGRFAGVTDSAFQFSGSLVNLVAAADLKQNRLLDAIDEHAQDCGLDTELPEPYRPMRTTLPEPRLVIPHAEFDAIIWATGYRPCHQWLGQHLLDRKGAIRHDGGGMTLPGMYVIGLPFLRTRRSGLIDGVGRDAEFLSDHLLSHIATTPSGSHSWVPDTT